MKVLPFLMFQGEANAALALYADLFPDAKIEDVQRYGPDGPGPEGSVISASFTLGGQTVLCNDSPVKHAFTFTPSVSFFVTCEDEAQIDRLFAGLSKGGVVRMPLANYGFSQKFGWTDDPYGVSWQINLP